MFQRNASNYAIFYVYEIQVVLFLFISCNFTFYLINDVFYVDIDQGIHRSKSKVAHNEKQTYLNAWILL